MSGHFSLLFLFKELRIAFMMFDKDADGVINTQELLQVFKQLGMDTSTEQVCMIRRY